MQISYHVGHYVSQHRKKDKTLTIFITYNNMEITLTRSFENVYAEVIATAIVLQKVF